MLHYLEVVDATPWYSVFSMIILPINSVINPLLYNDFITRNVGTVLSQTMKRVSLTASTLSERVRYSVSGPQENIELQGIEAEQ
jgi:hypothetical protein